MELLFWILMGLVAWCYAGYPAVMMARAAVAGRAGPAAAPAATPHVSVVVAVRNEVGNIRERMENLLGQHYPADRLEVIVVCNGCTDGTEAAAGEVAERDGRARVLLGPAEEGKTGALNRGVAAAQGRVVVFADGRQRFHADAVRRLVDALADPTVGAVSGRTVIARSDSPALQGVGLYWGMETNLRIAESRTGSMVQAQGAIYAIRRELFVPFPPNLILDDVYLPMRIAMQGYRLSIAPEAVAFDVPAEGKRQEYKRKLRTMIGNLQLLRAMPEVLSPARNPVFLRFVSHKLLRVASPILLLGALLVGAFLRGPLYQGLVGAQLAFYAMGVLGLFLPVRLFSVPAAFVLVHLAVLGALARPGRGAQDVWVRDGGGVAPARR